jgi:hypothetical protein
MMKDGDISGSYLLNVIKKHISSETSDSVIAENLQHNIPAIINNYIPLHLIEHEYSEVFELILEKMLAPKLFKENITLHLLLECVVQSARNEKHIELVR